MSTPNELAEQLQQRLDGQAVSCKIALEEVTLEIPRESLRAVCRLLRDEPAFAFEQLMDVCGVDYLSYGCSEWQTEQATSEGFSRGVETDMSGVNYLAYGKAQWNSQDLINLNFAEDVTASSVNPDKKLATRGRFAVVYHLLSVSHNHRLRLRVFAGDEPPLVDSVVDIWASANWFEREAFDLYGILFAGHPDLRRILTDYGFIGHPFRKDFPLSGHVEVRYDEQQQRVIYQPVTIEPRILVPRVVRNDHRYSENIKHAQQVGSDNG